MGEHIEHFQIIQEKIGLQQVKSHRKWIDL